MIDVNTSTQERIVNDILSGTFYNRYYYWCYSG